MAANKPESYHELMLIALAFIAILGQVAYWNWHKPNTEALDDKVWLACVNPGVQA
jgi:hypothetical protein